MAKISTPLFPGLDSIFSTIKISKDLKDNVMWQESHEQRPLQIHSLLWILKD